MIVDGKAIAAEILQGVANALTHLDHAPHLTVFTCAPNFETKKYLSIKRKQALALGLGINVIEFPETVTTDDVLRSMAMAQMQTDGIIVQLPFPPHFNRDAVLAAIPPALDVDQVHYDGTSETLLPPVVGAIKEISHRHDVRFAGARVVVIGEGKLVGQPAALWSERQGAQVTVLTKESTDVATTLLGADIIIAGAGVPGLITPDMLTEGVVIFDASTSEDGGVLRGDAAPACAGKASIFTPVPGGIGPITIAVLFANLLRLATFR